MQQPALSQAQDIEGILMSLDFEQFRSAQAIAVLLGKGVSVNAPLKVGTLLLAAASNGWEDMVDCLIRKGAALNARGYFGKYDGILDALISSHRQPSPAIIALFVKGGVHFNGQTLISAWRWTKPVGTYWDFSGIHLEKRKELLLMLLEHVSDLNNTWDSSPQGGYETSALIKAVTMGQPDLVRLLSKHGANVNLRVETQNYNNALESVFHEILSQLEAGSRGRFYAERNMINLLVEQGASLDNLEGDRLSKALAAVAFAGWEEPMQHFLHRGASPYKRFSRKLFDWENLCWEPVGREAGSWNTALHKAVESDHPERPLIVHTLLNNGTSVKDNYEYYVAASSVFDRFFREVLADSLPFSLQKLELGVRLEIALVLARSHAVWNGNFMQWDSDLKSKRPDVWSHSRQGLLKLTKKLSQNRARFLEKFPYAESLNEWRFL